MGAIEPQSILKRRPQVAMSTAALGNSTGGQPHDNMTPYLVVNFIIALFGVYPSQN